MRLRITLKFVVTAERFSKYLAQILKSLRFQGNFTNHLLKAELLIISLQLVECDVQRLTCILLFTFRCFAYKFKTLNCRNVLRTIL